MSTWTRGNLTLEANDDDNTGVLRSGDAEKPVDNVDAVLKWGYWTEQDDGLVAAMWDESKHPRNERGSESGGRFRSLKAVQEANPDVLIQTTEGEDKIVLDGIMTLDPGQGKASKALDDIGSYADSVDKSVVLTPKQADDEDPGFLSSDELEQWYRRHGYEDNEGPGHPLIRKPEQADAYRGVHTSPGRDSGSPLSDLADPESGVYPDDVYSSDAARLYGHGGDADTRRMDAETVAILQSYRGKPDAPIEVFRGVPIGVTEINPGDWVTPNADYAAQHSMADNPEDDGDVISRVVRAGDLFTDGNSIHEFGWDPVELTAAFDPGKHPKVPGGRREGGQWARKSAYVPARVGIGSPEIEDLKAKFDADPMAVISQDGPGQDGALDEIARIQGFDGLPEVVSHEELMSHLPQWDEMGNRINEGDGSTELWRGLQHKPETYYSNTTHSWEQRPADVTGEQAAEIFRHGEYWAGTGTYGNGIYTAEGRNVAVVYSDAGNQKNGDTFDRANPYAAKSILHMAIRPEAKVGLWTDVRAQWLAENGIKENLGFDGTPSGRGVLTQPNMTRSIKEASAQGLYADIGRYAAAAGYDAIRMDDGSGFWVVFNRTALIVAEAPPDAGGGL